jgi:DNA polymerase-4
MGPGFVEALPVKKFHGVGPATSAKMERLGITTGAELKVQSLDFLQQHFGKSGLWYYRIARGIDERPVEPNRLRKSIGAEDTFAVDIFDLNVARQEMSALVAKVWRHCEGKGMRGRTVTLKVKYADFQQITRSRTASGTIMAAADMEGLAADLLEPLFPIPKGIRLIGVTVSGLEDHNIDTREQIQLPLF